MSTPIKLPAEALAVPHLEQYFGVWAIHENTFLSLFDRVGKIDLSAHVQAAAGSGRMAAADAGVVMDANGIATIELRGALTKYGSSMSSAPSMLMTQRAVRGLTDDPACKGVMMIFDSPGGTVSGTSDLAEAIASCAAVKPVMGFIEDLGASAAYWLASQCTTIVANPSAMVGSIGTYGVLQDSSRMAANAGVTVHVIRAGAFKGAGVPGTEITDQQLAEYQRIVDGMNAMFLGGVARGRRMKPEQVTAIADGRVHQAADAKKMGLIDAVQSLAAATSAFTASVLAKPSANKSTPRLVAKADVLESTVMSDKTDATVSAPKPATIAELKAEFPESTADFREKCMEGGLTIDASYRLWAKEKQAEATAAKAETEALRAQAKKPGAPALPNKPPTAKAGDVDAEASGDPIAEWNQRLDAKTKGGMKRPDAVAQLSKEDPELHQAYIQAYTAAHPEALPAAQRRAMGK